MTACKGSRVLPGARWRCGLLLAATIVLSGCGSVIAQTGSAANTTATSNATSPEQFILNGEFRFYGAGIANRSDDVIATVTQVAKPILASFSLNLVRLNKTDAIAAVTPGLEGYDAVDAAFFFTVTDLTADLSNILSYSSASVLLRLLSGQLQQAGLDVGVQLLWVDYTSTIGQFPQGGEPPNFQAVRTQLEVSGQQLMPFTEDKQTVLLVALRNAYQTVNAPLVCLNVTDWQAGSGSARKLLAVAQTIKVDVEYIITPPTNQTMTALWTDILTPGFPNATSELGLRMTVTYGNSTIRLEGPTGQRYSVTCDPPYAQCLADAAAQLAPSPTPSSDSGSSSSSSSNAALIGGVVGGVVGGLLLLVLVLVAVLLCRRRRRQHVDVSTSKFSAASSDAEAADGKQHAADAAGAGSSSGRRGLLQPLRSLFGGATPAAVQHSNGTPGNQRSLDQMKDLRDSARMNSSEALGETRKQRLRNAAQFAARRLGSRDPAAIPAAEIQLCRRADGSDFVLGEGAFGKVHKGLRNGVQEVAVKMLTHGCDEVLMQELQREVAILRRVSADANIVQFYGAVFPDGAVSPKSPAMLVMEYMQGGDLRHALAADEDDEFRWSCRGRDVAIDIARGLHHLHSSGVVHRDLKSSNILLTAEGRAKIADVGLAKVATAYFSSANTIGTLTYAAPEMLLGHHCTQKVDIYSFGVVLWELVTARTPVRGQLGDLSDCERCPPAVAALFRDCTVTDAADRPTAAEVFRRLDAAA